MHPAGKQLLLKWAKHSKTGRLNIVRSDGLSVAQIHFDIVDQAGFRPSARRPVPPTCSSPACATCPACRRRASSMIAPLPSRVASRPPRRRFPARHTRSLARGEGFGHDAQVAVKARRFGTFGCAQIAVAPRQTPGRRQRWPVSTGTMSIVDVQVFHYGSNHCQLLKIFFAQSRPLAAQQYSKVWSPPWPRHGNGRRNLPQQLVLHMRRLYVVTLRHARIERLLIGHETPRPRHRLAACRHLPAKARG